MAATKATKKGSEAGKRLVVLLILVIALVASLAVGTATTKGNNKFTPDLALDLEGGTELILTPITTDGSDITDSDVTQAIDIIRQRVDASGVAEAEITSQGGSNIVVSLPGTPSKETLDLVRTSAVLRMRTVLAMYDPNQFSADAIAAAQEKSSAASTEGTEGDAAAATTEQTLTATEAPEASETTTATEDEAEQAPAATYTDEERQAAAMKQADVNGDGQLSDAPATDPANASDTAWITEQVVYDAIMLTCGSNEARLAATSDDPDQPIAACGKDVYSDENGKEIATYTKYILGPAEIEGTNISKATSSLAVNDQGTPTGGWAVNIELNSKGADIFADVTGRIYQNQEPLNRFAIVLDGQVLSAPAPSEPIAGGRAQITGSFTSSEAAALANQLSFGSLPLNFTVQSENQISATLGADQLEAGLIAGLIGLGLIVIYMLWQYHMLGIISAASIALSTGLSYLVVCLLSWTMGYRLSMAGVLGLIVSVGITADSFIVYFERIRDEIRDGHTIPGAIRHGWERAKRTIIISDAVNLIAAVVLYILTVGSVRGFAFTLGITTILDLIVVMMFTHPLMVLFIKTKYFGEGRKFSGLEESQLQRTPLYRGRGSGDLKHGSADRWISGNAGDTSMLTQEAIPLAMSEATTLPALLDGEGETLAQRKARERAEKKKLKEAKPVIVSPADGTEHNADEILATDDEATDERSDV